jgi:hypothetical protein
MRFNAFCGYLVKLALDKTDPAQMIPKLLKFTVGISDEFERAILKINECLAWMIRKRRSHILAKDGLAKRRLPGSSLASCRPSRQSKLVTPKTDSATVQSMAVAETMPLMAAMISPAWSGFRMTA